MAPDNELSCLTQTFRSEYFKWCIPLFGTPTTFNNYTCSFLATQGDLFFVNITASTWEDNECCLFAKVGTLRMHPHAQEKMLQRQQLFISL